MTEQMKRAVCRWCHARCRVVVHTENGRLVKIEEDRTDPRVDTMLPRTKGCLRLSGAKEYIYHPDRVKYPLKRIGDKGENRWEKITWEQALDEIAGKLEVVRGKYGPESLMITSGTSRTLFWPRVRFANLFGSPNLAGQGSICYGPDMAMTAAMIGWVGEIPDAPLPITTDANGKLTTRCILLLGMNPSHAHPRVWKTVRDAQRMGAKIIVVDPRRTETAEIADIWLQPRPGTDVALLMSMIRVIIEEKLYDREFVEKWCYGFDKVEERAKEYPLQKVAEITGVPAGKIKEAAMMFATQRPGISRHGMGMEHLENGLEAIQARIILTAIVGNIDVEGGEYIPGPGSGSLSGDQMDDEKMGLAHLVPDEQKKKQLGADRFKLLCWPGRDLICEHSKKWWGSEPTLRAYANYPLVLRAIVTGKPYPVRAGITTFSNPMVTQANTKLVYKALRSLDLYVVHDFWLTPGAQIADYVLPAASWLERPQFEQTPKIVAGEAALPAVKSDEFEYWTDYEFWRGLGIRLGQEKYWPWRTLEEAFDYQLKPLGISFRKFMDEKDGIYFPPNEYKKYERMGGFGTPTGKLELYSAVLERLGYDPLPCYREPMESPVSTPDLAKDYPLMLITGGRFSPYFHSEQRQIESIRKRRPDPQVQIHPETARKLGIENGDWVWIETVRGRVKQRCLYFDGIRPQVVHAEHGWWFPELPGEEPWLRGVWKSSINVVTSDDPERCNPRSGGWPLRTALCKVYKCKVY
jgi:thiosulfate reductase/polysulfide reductase chain A